MDNYTLNNAPTEGRTKDPSTDSLAQEEKPALRVKRLLGVIKKLTFIVSAMILIGIGMAYAIPIPKRLATKDSTLILYNNGVVAHIFLAQDDRWRIGRPYKEVDPDFIAALIRLEDERFWSHVGVDPIAITRAMISNISRGKIVSGASTLTMQLARMLEPRPRTLFAKILDAMRAFQLEVRYSKGEILTQYLRFAPYGRNIEGVDAAALTYFGHRADDLSAAEIVTLLAVPQAPNKRYPSLAHENTLRKARDMLARKLLTQGALPRGEGQSRLGPEEIYAQIKAQNPPVQLAPFPRHLPHTAPWLRRRYPRKALLKTTLDQGLQNIAHRILKKHHETLREHNVHNGSAVIMEHGSRKVRALIGNFDFEDREHGGQIVGFDIPRSTGSLLKPTIMAMAMDRGYVHPKMMVPDVPRSRGGWSPRNFDGTYSGLIRLEQALVKSLNVPFVDLIERLGVPSLISLLHRADFKHIVEHQGHYGLSIAIGGVEATPLEIAGLYATMAQSGTWMPLAFLDQESALQSRQAQPLYSPAASWLTRQVLGLKERPDLRWRRTNTVQDDWHIHWKTGTSNGHRDAWSVGSGATYTTAVWLGNFDYKTSKLLVGATSAAPVMFDLLEAIEMRNAPESIQPADLKQIEVCSFTGYISDLCIEHQKVWVPIHGVPMQKSPYHRQIEVDEATGLAISPECRGRRKTLTRTIIEWPTHIAKYLKAHALAKAQTPHWAPGCAPAVARLAPKIRAPSPGQQVMLIPGIPATQQNVPFEAESSDLGQLDWFVDGVFLGSAPSSQRMWWTPSSGTHDIVVTDRTGRSATQTIIVNARHSARPR